MKAFLEFAIRCGMIGLVAGITYGGANAADAGLGTEETIFLASGLGVVAQYIGGKFLPKKE